MPIRLKPIRRPRMTLRDERAQAFRAALADNLFVKGERGLREWQKSSR